MIIQPVEKEGRSVYIRTSHTEPTHDDNDRPFHPGIDRRREALYLAHDAEAISPTITDRHMPITATATALTWGLVFLEMLIFLWLFGPWGLFAITISTFIYTMVDKRARHWLSRRLKNNSDGSAG